MGTSTHHTIFGGLYEERPNRGWFGMKMKNAGTTAGAGAVVCIATSSSRSTWLTFKMVTAGATACGGNAFSKVASRKVIGVVVEDAGIASGSTGAVAMAGPIAGIQKPGSYSDGDTVGLGGTSAGVAGIRSTFGNGVIFGYICAGLTNFPNAPTDFVYPYRL